MDGAKIGNWVLFAAAAAWAIGLATWLTFDFLNKDTPSVSAELVLLGSGFIAAYAGNNRMYKAHCTKENGKPPRAKPGELFFIALVAWAVAMPSLYYTKALWYWMGKEVDGIPGNFVLYMGLILGIFTGTKLWDTFSLFRRPSNEEESKHNGA